MDHLSRELCGEIFKVGVSLIPKWSDPHLVKYDQTSIYPVVVAWSILKHGRPRTSLFAGVSSSGRIPSAPIVPEWRTVDVNRSQTLSRPAPQVVHRDGTNALYAAVSIPPGMGTALRKCRSVRRTVRIVVVYLFVRSSTTPFVTIWYTSARFCISAPIGPRKRVSSSCCVAWWGTAEGAMVTSQGFVRFIKIMDFEWKCTISDDAKAPLHFRHSLNCSQIFAPQLDSHFRILDRIWNDCTCTDVLPGTTDDDWDLIWHRQIKTYVKPNLDPWFLIYHFCSYKLKTEFHDSQEDPVTWFAGP